MKRLTRFSIAAVITLLLSVVAVVGVWASPGRTGTVPTPPPDGIGNCAGGSATINVVTAIARVSGTDCKVTVKRGDPFGTLPAGWKYLLSEVLEVKVVEGAVSKVEVCVPFNPDWKDKVVDKSIDFFYWNSAKNAWVAVPTVIKNNETPPVVCGTGTSAGFYALFGK